MFWSRPFYPSAVGVRPNSASPETTYLRANRETSIADQAAMGLVALLRVLTMIGNVAVVVPTPAAPK